jgi:hypothetical protein
MNFRNFDRDGFVNWSGARSLLTRRGAGLIAAFFSIAITFGLSSCESSGISRHNYTHTTNLYMPETSHHDHGSGGL